MRLATAAVAVLLVLTVGCAKRTTPASTSTITDITPAYATTPEPAYTPAPAYTATPYPADAYAAAPSAPAPERYTIKKGDTLYSIARNRYGDGKQWSRIAQANPGIDPQKLAVGQVITIP